MNIAIVGVSGAVGREFLIIIEEFKFHFDNLLLFGSAKSAGKIINFLGKDYIIKELKQGDDFKDVDIAFVSAGADISKKFASTITKYGAIMIDNSSAFRMDPDIPLVVPEVNLEDAKFAPKNIISNPNCTTIQLVVALNPIHKINPIKRVQVATYQAASGAGNNAMLELEKQAKELLSGEAITTYHFAHQLAFNLIPQVDVFSDFDYTKEELKMYYETRKIMHSDIQVSATCVRVPVMRAHSEAVWVECENEVNIEQIRELYKNASGVILLDNPHEAKYPMPAPLSGHNQVYVGRLRKDISNKNGFTFWCVSDQIRKGAALNAIQIAISLRESSSENRLFAEQ